MKFGEIYICRFPFTSGAASKARPALVLFDLGLDVLICRITSAASSTPLDITIADWSSAGLAKLHCAIRQTCHCGEVAAPCTAGRVVVFGQSRDSGGMERPYDALAREGA